MVSGRVQPRISSLGVTLSEEQALWAQQAIKAPGLEDLAGVRYLNGKLKVGGRMLNHCITRPDNTGPSIYRDGFINRYVFPDGELEGPGWLAGMMNDNGFEIRHEENLREHYSKTLMAWCDNLDAHWDEAVAEVGMGTARVWKLYMAGCILGFDRNVVQLHQILGVKLNSGGNSG